MRLSSQTILATFFAYSAASCAGGYINECGPPGQVWQWSADGATGMSGIYTIPILTSSSDPVAHNFCLCTNNHLLLTAIIEGLSDSGPSSDELIAEMRDIIIADCQDRATELSLTDDTCAEAVDSNYPPVDLDDDCDSCYDGYSIVDENPLICGPLPMDTGDETGNETGNPLNNLTSHVSCSMGTCEVTEELVQYVLDYPDAYLNNGAIVVPYQPTGPVYGFQLTSVPAGCLADILGFEEDDVITKINNVTVGDLGNWATIASGLVSASTMTVTYERSSSQYTLTITVEE